MSERPVVEVALFTDDVEALKQFYGQLLDTAPEAEWPGGAVFSAAGVKVLVHERGAAMEGGPPNEDHVAVGVDDLDAACATLQANGFMLLLERQDFPWGRSAYLRDPDGRLVELAQI